MNRANNEKYETSDGTIWVCPDDAPELTAAFFERADEHQGARLVKHGTLKAVAEHVNTSIRLAPEENLEELTSYARQRWRFV